MPQNIILKKIHTLFIFFLTMCIDRIILLYNTLNNDHIFYTHLRKGRSMSERINISIPGDLHKRLSHFKDRLNISKICQEAISIAVNIETMKDETASDLDGLINRLRKEKAAHVAVYRETGFKDGMKDAFKLSYEDFAEFDIVEGAYTFRDLFSMLGSEETQLKFEEGSELWQDHLNYPEIDFQMHEDEYLSGWVSGVSHVWDEVKKKL